MDKKNEISNPALRNYLEAIALPNSKIKNKHSISRSFHNKGMETLWSAIEYVHQLPYGRTTDRANYRQVLEENKGACSTKHALLASLAKELKISLKLVLGILLLTRENTPNLAPFLDKYHITAIPEAHCYLLYENHYLDITFAKVNLFQPSLNALQEQVITPEQIGNYKIKFHQSFIYSWLGNDSIAFDRLWKAREAWIAHLSHL